MYIFSFELFYLFSIVFNGSYIKINYDVSYLNAFTYYIHIYSAFPFIMQVGFFDLAVRCSGAQLYPCVIVRPYMRSFTTSGKNRIPTFSLGRIAFPLFSPVSIYYATVLLMGKKGDSTEEEAAIVLRLLGDGKTTLEVAKELCRDHRTIKAHLQRGGKRRCRAKNVVTASERRELRKLKLAMRKRPLSTSKELYEAAGVKMWGEALQGVKAVWFSEDGLA